MKKFLIKILVFILPLFILLGAFEFLLRMANFPNIYTFKNEIINKKHEAIVLGNSHALRGIIAKDLDYNAISLANVSQSINIDYKWLLKSTRKNNLKFLILNFSIPTLTGDLFYSRENWRIKNYNIYTDLQLNHKIEHNFELLNNKQIDNLNTILEYKNGLESGILSKGSFPVDTIQSTEFIEKHAIKSAKRHTNNTNYIQDNIHTLEKIIKLSKEKNFDVIIVTPPTSDYYRNLIPNNILKILSENLNRVDKKNSNVYWLNFYKDNTFDSSHFKDSDHLNLKGARKLTELINLFLQEKYPI